MHMGPPFNENKQTVPRDAAGRNLSVSLICSLKGAASFSWWETAVWRPPPGMSTQSE